VGRDEVAVVQSFNCTAREEREGERGRERNREGERGKKQE